MKILLALETSCDDTAAAIVDEQGSILADIIFSQTKVHEPFGGVVPEIGSRSHIEQILWVVKQAFDQASLTPNDIDAVAATFAPGLIGPLLVGAQFAKGFANARSIPLIGVHHIAGHVLAGYLTPGFKKPPFIALIASGGHSAIYRCEEDFSIKLLGETLDDAAGEAFDKVGRALGFSYPAGKIIDQWASLGNKSAYDFPIAMRGQDHFNFSFSGLKTRAIQTIKNLGALDQTTLANVCASLQEAITQALSERAIQAVKRFNTKSLVVGGGVAANSGLREKLTAMCDENDFNLYLPPKRYCTDNAVMIAKAALIRLKNNAYSDYSTEVAANLPVENTVLI